MTDRPRASSWSAAARPAWQSPASSPSKAGTDVSTRHQHEGSRMQPHTEAAPPNLFPKETTGLPACRRPEIVDLSDGAALDLEIAPVAKQLGDATVRML